MNLLNVNNIITYSRESSFSFRSKKSLPFIFDLKKFGCTIALLFCFIISNAHGLEQSNFSYVDECKTECARYRDPFTCGKFRAVQWLHNLTNAKDIHYGPLRLVRLASATQEPVLPEVPKSREFGRYSKFLNFVRSSAEDMLTRRALVYTVEQRASSRSLSSGPLILETDELDEFVESGISVEDRGLKKKKKKLSVILPLLILLKIFKLKLLLIPILLGVHFIKKILLIGAFALSSLIVNLKYCKIPPSHHHTTPYHGWSTAADSSADYSIGSGHDDDGWSQKIDMMGYGGGNPHDAYAANAQRNPYRGYYHAFKQQQL